MSAKTKVKPVSEQELDEQKERLRYLEHLININRKEQEEALDAVKKRNANRVSR